MTRVLGSSQIISGALAALIGFASSFAIVLAGLQAMGATPAQAIVGLGALKVATGILSIVLAVYFKMPIALAWSTPGAAFLATMSAPAGGFSEACGAFLVSSIAIALTGMVPPLRRAIEAIPPVLSSAMLAGILVNICLIPINSLVMAPWIVGPVILVWLVVSLFSALYSIPAAVVAAIGVMALTGAAPVGWSVEITTFEPLMPSVGWASVIGIALPLYLITMTSQNLAGQAVLRSYDYHPPLAPILKSTGAVSAVCSLFGAHHVNLAALTSAMCANPSVGPYATRYGSVIAAGVVFILTGLASAMMVPWALAAPANLIPAIAGLALVPAAAGALKQAMTPDQGREAALICFVVTLAGVEVFGVGSAFWGLVAGGVIYSLRR